MHTLNRILIIRFSSVGDIVLSSLLVRVLRRRFPHSQIDYLVKAEFGDLLRYSPYLTQVIPFQKGESFAKLAEFRRRIRAVKYDLIVDIQESLRSRYFCAGAQQVVRISKRKFARFALVKFKVNFYKWFGRAPSVALRYLETVARFGVTDDGDGLELFVPPAVEEKVHQMVRGLGHEGMHSLVGVCPSAKHGNKLWPAERFAAAAATLSNDTRTGVVLFGWSDEEEERCTEIERRIGELEPNTAVMNVAGKLSLAETASLMDHCIIVLSNDSGLMHVAAARKRKLVAIFGPTVREFGFFPFRTPHAVVENASLHCRPCTHIGLPECPKRHFKCMNDIPVSRVIQAARDLLRQ